MLKDNKLLIDKKIRSYMKKLSKYFDSLSYDSDNDRILNDSIFNFNPTGDIAIGIHSCRVPQTTHRHDFFEMVYIYSGKCTQNIDSTEMVLKKGELCLINTKAKHKIITENDEDNILFNFMFKKSFFTNYFLNLICENNTVSSFLINYLFDENSESNYLIFNISQSETIDKIILLIINEFLDERPGFRSILESLYVILFIEISRHSTINNSSFTDNRKSNKFNEIMNYLEENFAATNLQETAKYFHYHPNYLSKEIKEITNKTYSEILQNIKLKHACFYLAKTSLSIQDIISKVGYSELSHFYRIFKKNFTLTPNEYRRKMQQTKSQQTVIL